MIKKEKKLFLNNNKTYNLEKVFFKSFINIQNFKSSLIKGKLLTIEDRGDSMVVDVNFVEKKANIHVDFHRKSINSFISNKLVKFSKHSNDLEIKYNTLKFYYKDHKFDINNMFYFDLYNKINSELKDIKFKKLQIFFLAKRNIFYRFKILNQLHKMALKFSPKHLRYMIFNYKALNSKWKHNEFSFYYWNLNKILVWKNRQNFYNNYKIYKLLKSKNFNKLLLDKTIYNKLNKKNFNEYSI